jgi:hypothetical protein
MRQRVGNVFRNIESRVNETSFREISVLSEIRLCQSPAASGGQSERALSLQNLLDGVPDALDR